MRKYRQEVGKVQDLIARLIRCSIPRETAVFLCRHFLRAGGIVAFEQYVEAVEAECRVEMDQV